MTNILTKDDITAFAPELDLSAYSDTTISGMLAQAQRRAEKFCSVMGFDQALETDETDNALISNDGNLIISVRRRPIVTVTAIKLVRGGFSTTLTLTQNGTPLYQIPYPNHKLILPNSYLYTTGTYLAGGNTQLMTLRGAHMMYQITYMGGYQTIPDDLKLAVMLYFRDGFAKQYNTQNLGSFSQGAYSETYRPNSNGRSPYVEEAESILLNGGYARLEF